MLEPTARKVDQHLSYVRCLLDSAEQCASRHIQNAHLQSALLQMGLAWDYYLVELGARYGVRELSPSPNLMDLPDGAVWLDKVEGLELAAVSKNPESWLVACRGHLKAIWRLEKRTGLAGSLFSYQEPASDLIAATADPELPILTPALMRVWEDQFQGLVRRQRGCQEEY